MKSHHRKTELEKQLEAELASESIEGAEPSAGETEPETAAVDIVALQKERDDLSDQLLRMRAEFDNFRKRMMREAERTRQFAAESLIRDLLPVVDNLELAVKHREGGNDALAEGVEMVLRQFHEVLTRHGVEPIVAAGQAFDPEVHEAVSQREHDEVPAQSVIEDFQKGYKLGQLVLRPAKVVVSSGIGGAEDLNPE